MQFEQKNRDVDSPESHPCFNYVFLIFFILRILLDSVTAISRSLRTSL